MNYEEMLTWSLFYISLFDMAKQPMVDVVDPHGLVRSQAIESPDGALRLTLNGAETHRTFAGRFIADSFGSSGAACRLRDGRHLGPPPARWPRTASSRCRSRKTTMTTSPPASGWTRRCVESCAR